jgi:drug/metabolite transporter (DMT)-like permease
LALFLLLAGSFAIGFSPTFVRLSEIGPVATAVHRVALALPLLFLVLAVQPREGATTPSRALPETAADVRDLILAGLFFAGDLAFWHWSIMETTVANATLFATSTPIFVTLAAWLWLGERITRRFLVGLALSLAGAAMLAGSSFQSAPGHLYGDFLGVVTALFFSAYLLTVKRLRQRMSAAAIMAWSGVVTAVMLAGLNLWAVEQWLPLSLSGWAILIGLALISHAAGQGLVAQALGRLPASFSAVGMLSEPVFAGIIAWVVLHEAISPLQAAGGGVILAGIVLARPRNFADAGAPAANKASVSGSSDEAGG